MNIEILEATTIQRQTKQVRMPKKFDNSKWIDNFILLGKKDSINKNKATVVIGAGQVRAIAAPLSHWSVLQWAPPPGEQLSMSDRQWSHSVIGQHYSGPLPLPLFCIKGASRRNQPSQHLGFRLLASRTRRHKSLLFEAIQFMVLWYGKPRVPYNALHLYISLSIRYHHLGI